MSLIHATAIVDPKAELDSSVQVGPYTIIGPHVRIGAGTTVGPHCVIEGHTTIGNDNRIFQFNSLGAIPQDKKYAGEPCELVIGDRNTIREFCTFNIGSPGDTGVTKLGNDNWIMAYVHLAHDCIVGSNTIFANNVGISGHVEVGDWAILGGYAGVNQFLKIGAHAMIGGMTHVSNDVPAFVIVSGTPPEARSINAIGLERRGFDKETVQLIRRAFKILYKKGLLLQEAIEQLEPLAQENEQVRLFLDSILSSTRGIQR